MGSNTKIAYVHSTINGSSGCDGCELWNSHTRTCYAGQLHEIRLAKSLPALYAPTFSTVQMIPGRFSKAAAWGPPSVKENEGKPWLAGRRRHIFVGDMGDFLSQGVSDEFLLCELFGAIGSKAGQRHVWVLLTKRPGRLADLSEQLGGLPDNVIAMTTVTDQQTADSRISELIRVRCKTRGLSIEPMLGPIDIFNLKNSGLGCVHIARNIHWVICGGESGDGARPMHPDWARGLRDQCDAAGVPFFFKQWGEWQPFSTTDGRQILPFGNYDVSPENRKSSGFLKKGKLVAGRLLDGKEHNGFPGGAR